MTSSEKRSQLEDVLSRFQAKKLFTHAYGEVGWLDQEKEIFSCSLQPDGKHSLYDLSSLTKALVTTPLVIQEFFHKKIPSLDIPLGDLAPQEPLFAASPFKQLLLSAVLRHKSGLVPWRNLFSSCLEGSSARRRTVDEVFCGAWKSSLVDVDTYSDVGFLLLERALVSRRGGLTLEQQFQELLVQLDLPKNYLGRGEIFPRFQVVPTGFCPLRGRMLQGEVHDENAFALGGFTGHAGLFGSGPHVSTFLKRLMRSELGQLLFEVQKAELKPPPHPGLMGWRQGDDLSSETFGKGFAMGHMGFTGVSFWLDPVDRSYAILLTNRTFYGRGPREIKEFRRICHELFTQMLQVC